MLFLLVVLDLRGFILDVRRALCGFVFGLGLDVFFFFTRSSSGVPERDMLLRNFVQI